MSRTQMQLEDWLDDLCVRFIINLPEEDLSSVARLCFQVEEAQWFYEDFIRPLDPNLPSMSLRTFCLRIFQHCPLLAQFSVENHTKAFEEFLEYKTRIPVRGAIMLNHAMDAAVLVRGWKKGANWGFPGGKINKDEDDLDCAIREVYEETGFDVRAAGLAPSDGKTKYIELPIRNHQVRLYVFRDVPMDTNFQPRTRKEISKIQWYKLSELPTFRKKTGQNTAESGASTNANKFYMVAPFMVPLKKWVSSQKKSERRAVEANNYLYPTMAVDKLSAEEEGWTQTETDVPIRAPAIETLDGASLELQRLLKMQPPTQGIQPINLQQDKGSALLSMLQSKGTSSVGGSQEAAQMQRTPLDQLFAPVPQARNPHHHTNQQIGHLATGQPPPAFQIGPNQASHYGNSHGAAAPTQQHFNQNQTTLVHPQPLPPQVQRAIFDKSAVQEGRQPPLHSQVLDGRDQQVNHGQQQQASPFELRPQPQAKPTKLNGQSLALLNAFKRDNPGTQDLVSGATAGGITAAEMGYQARSSTNSFDQGPPGHAALVNMAQQQTPTELAGSLVNPKTATHKSALLGMFKRGPEAAGNAAAAVASNDIPPEKSQPPHTTDLLLQLQGQGQGRRDVSQAPFISKASQASFDPSSQLRSNHLAVQSNSKQRVEAGAPTSTDHQPQPVRILQRNQHARSQNAQMDAPSLASPHGLQAQPAAPLPGSTNATSMPMPGVASDHGQEPPSEQKRQLLSLFGKQQSPPGTAAVLQPLQNQSVGRQPPIPNDGLPSAGPGTARGSVSSSRRGDETPMSPAEQSFLLGYLQSVTNTASR